jgi:hypothetical protein
MTPYSLVYGGEAVLPLEVQITSLRVAIQEKLTEEEAPKLRLKELDNLEESGFMHCKIWRHTKLGCLELSMSD